MNACNCYEVITAGTVDALNEAVHQKICAGMVPCGGVAIIPTSETSFGGFAQAMVGPATLGKKAKAKAR